jgi:hypothetical protein
MLETRLIPWMSVEGSGYNAPWLKGKALQVCNAVGVEFISVESREEKIQKEVPKLWGKGMKTVTRGRRNIYYIKCKCDGEGEMLLKLVIKGYLIGYNRYDLISN